MAKRIDITPTWSDMLPLMLTLAENGRMHDEVREEFHRMAALADKAVADERKLDDQKRRLYHAIGTIEQDVKGSRDFPISLLGVLNNVRSDIVVVVRDMEGDEK